MQWSTDKEQMTNIIQEIIYKENQRLSNTNTTKKILPVAIGKEYSVSVHAVSVHQKTLTLKY
jgi:hypothetical protein